MNEESLLVRCIALFSRQVRKEQRFCCRLEDLRKLKVFSSEFTYP